MTDLPPPSAGDLVADAVTALQAGGLGPVTAAVVLGSGWRPAADLLGETVAEWAYADLPPAPNEPSRPPKRPATRPSSPTARRPSPPS